MLTIFDHFPADGNPFPPHQVWCALADRQLIRHCVAGTAVCGSSHPSISDALHVSFIICSRWVCLKIIWVSRYPLVNNSLYYLMAKTGGILAYPIFRHTQMIFVCFRSFLTGWPTWNGHRTGNFVFFFNGYWMFNGFRFFRQGTKPFPSTTTPSSISLLPGRWVPGPSLLWKPSNSCFFRGYQNG